MIIWLTGQTGSGKSTLARKLKRPNTIILDGDEIREVTGNKRLSKWGRVSSCLLVARLAKLIESQGFNVIVAVICPYRQLRKMVQLVCGCRFVYLPGGKKIDKDHPYEIPKKGEVYGMFKMFV